MNILFLYPHPAEDRSRQYRSAARTLKERFGHNVVFAYIGPRREFSDGVPTEHFESWVEENRAGIDAASLIDLERRLPHSNLWSGIVAQRTMNDYSYLGGSVEYVPYSLEEVETFLKSVVLFYCDLVARYAIDVAIAHAPDVIHSRILFELAPSLGYQAINQYYDPYWQRGRYMVDEVTYASSALYSEYARHLGDYETLVQPHEAEIDALIRHFGQSDPRKVLATQPLPTTAFATLATAFRALVSAPSRFALGRVDVWEGYWRRSFYRSVTAFLRRVRNLLARRLIPYASELPSRPYVFFGLHYQPEAVTLAAAPVWSDMLAIVRILSASLPAGFQLVVKDHPAIGGLRGNSFYRGVLALPNTVLLPESFPTRPAVENSRLVVTVAGTIGLQALLWGTPVLLLGHVYYDCIDGILRPPADLNDLPMMLKRFLMEDYTLSSNARQRSLRAFIRAYQSVIQFNEKMEYPTSPEEQGEGLAELIDGWISQLPVGSSREVSEERSCLKH